GAPNHRGLLLGHCTSLSAAGPRRECLDQVIVFDERHLRRVLSAYFEYHHHSRTHLSLAKDCPEPRLIQPPSTAPLLPSHRSAVCTIATSASQPELFAVIEPVPPSRCRVSSRGPQLRR